MSVPKSQRKNHSDYMNELYDVLVWHKASRSGKFKTFKNPIGPTPPPPPPPGRFQPPDDNVAPPPVPPPSSPPPSAPPTLRRPTRSEFNKRFIMNRDIDILTTMREKHKGEHCVRCRDLIDRNIAQTRGLIEAQDQAFPGMTILSSPPDLYKTYTGAGLSLPPPNREDTPRTIDVANELRNIHEPLRWEPDEHYRTSLRSPLRPPPTQPERPTIIFNPAHRIIPTPPPPLAREPTTRLVINGPPILNPMGSPF